MVKKEYVQRFCLTLLFLSSFFIFSCEADTSFPENPSALLEGSWHCSEQSNLFGNSEYTVTISGDTTNSDIVFVDNFYQLGTGRKVQIAIHSWNLEVADQTVDGNAISGSGKINSGFEKLVLDVKIDNQSEVDQVHMVLTTE